MKIPLRVLSWSYDDETKQITATFVDAPQPSDSDPVSFQPTDTYTVTFTPDSLSKGAVHRNNPQ